MEEWLNRIVQSSAVCVDPGCLRFNHPSPNPLDPQLTRVEKSLTRMILAIAKSMKQEKEHDLLGRVCRMLIDHVALNIAAGPEAIIEGMNQELAEHLVGVAQVSNPTPDRLRILQMANRILFDPYGGEICTCITWGMSATDKESLDSFTFKEEKAQKEMQTGFDAPRGPLLPTKNIQKLLVQKRVGATGWRDGKWKTSLEPAAQEFLKLVRARCEVVSEEIYREANWKLILEQLIPPFRLLAISGSDGEVATHPDLLMLNRLLMDQKKIWDLIEIRQKRLGAELTKRLGYLDVDDAGDLPQSSSCECGGRDQDPDEVEVKFAIRPEKMETLFPFLTGKYVVNHTLPSRSHSLYAHLPRRSPLRICSPHRCSNLNVTATEVMDADAFLLRCFKDVTQSLSDGKIGPMFSPVATFLEGDVLDAIIRSIISKLPRDFTLSSSNPNPARLALLRKLTRSACSTYSKANPHALAYSALGSTLAGVAMLIGHLYDGENLPCLCTIAKSARSPLPQFPATENKAHVHFDEVKVDSLSAHFLTQEREAGNLIKSVPDFNALIKSILSETEAYFASVNVSTLLSELLATFDYLGGANLYTLLLRGDSVRSERILANGANAAVSELIRLATDSPELLTPSLALDWKDAANFILQNNPLHVQDKMETALITMYDVAGLIDPTLVAAYTNSALVALRGNTPELMHRVIHDCTFALHFQPDNFKALYRRSIAFIFISEYGFAISDLKRALIIDPSNEAVVRKLKLATRKQR